MTLAGEFAEAIHVQRGRRIVLGVRGGASAIAAEHVVRADLHQWNVAVAAPPGEQRHRLGVDGEATLGVALGAIDLRVGGAVDDRLRRRRFENSGKLRGIGHIEPIGIESRRTAAQAGEKFAAELPARAGNQDGHRRFSQVRRVNRPPRDRVLVL
jgi:hypothetical protein